MKDKKIHPLNVIIITIGALSGLVVFKIQPSDDVLITWQDVLGMLLGSPLSMLFLCGIEFLKSPKDLKWNYPSLYSTVSDFSQPLNFMLTVGWAVTACGSVGMSVGILMASMSSSLPNNVFLISAFFLAAGVGILLGVKLTTIVFRSKMDQAR